MPSLGADTLHAGIFGLGSFVVGPQGRRPAIIDAAHLLIADQGVGEGLGRGVSVNHVDGGECRAVAVRQGPEILGHPDVLADFHHGVGLRIGRVAQVGVGAQHARQPETPGLGRRGLDADRRSHAPVDRAGEVGSSQFGEHVVEQRMGQRGGLFGRQGPGLRGAHVGVEAVFECIGHSAGIAGPCRRAQRFVPMGIVEGVVRAVGRTCGESDRIGGGHGLEAPDADDPFGFVGCGELRIARRYAPCEFLLLRGDHAESLFQQQVEIALRNLIGGRFARVEGGALVELGVVEPQGVCDARRVAGPCEFHRFVGLVRVEQQLGIGRGARERQLHGVFRDAPDGRLAHGAVLDRVVQVAGARHLPIDRGLGVPFDALCRQPVVQLLHGEGVRGFRLAGYSHRFVAGKAGIEADVQRVVGNGRGTLPFEGHLGFGGLLVEDDLRLACGSLEQDESGREFAARDGQPPHLVAPADLGIDHLDRPVEFHCCADGHVHGTEHRVELHGRQPPRVTHAGVPFAGGRELLVQPEAQLVVDEMPARTPREGVKRIGVFVVEDDDRVGLRAGQHHRLTSHFVEIVVLVAAAGPQGNDEQRCQSDISDDFVHGLCF